MIVLDTSVLVAILRGEPDADDFLARIVDTDRCLLSSVSLLETSMVLAGRSASPDAWTGLDQLIRSCRSGDCPVFRRAGCPGTRGLYLLRQGAASRWTEFR
ncbi:PIN domain-containing protein [Komagataeibacter kakiaceti]